MESGLYIPRSGSFTPRSAEGNAVMPLADGPASALRDPLGSMQTLPSTFFERPTAPGFDSPMADKVSVTDCWQCWRQWHDIDFFL